MRVPDGHSGFFTSEDLAEMQTELDRNAPPNESAVERENRALGMFVTKMTDKRSGSNNCN
jgi:hypothetical protein